MSKEEEHFWTFCKIRLKYFSDLQSETEWVLRIDNPFDLMLYWMEVSPNESAAALYDYRQAKIEKKGHFKHTLGEAAYRLAELKGSSFVDSLGILLGRKFEGMAQILKEGRILYIRDIGSYMFDKPEGKSYEILDTRVHPKLLFPIRRNIDIKRWQGGRHYYAKVGLLDVVVDGKNKWGSYTEAERATNEFLEAGV